MEIEFANCVLNTASRQLLRDGAAVAIEPKMYQLLEVLIERRPSVVTNEELDEILWPKVYVARTSLTRLVSELRTLLGDTPRESRIIRTVYKTGYSFVAEVADRSGKRPSGSYLQWIDHILHLREGENVLGRGAECTLTVDATTVSRRHARITVLRGVAKIEDLNSTNGTFVNREAATAPVVLKDGDEVSLGSASMRFRVSDRSAPTELRASPRE
jgi:DNA-binding winged helix-turn-helix (wHTH) protein